MLKNPVIAEGIAKAHPLKRLGEGKDSAALAKFLITEESSWVTGQVIAVDGGRSNFSYSEKIFLVNNLFSFISLIIRYLSKKILPKNQVF